MRQKNKNVRRCSMCGKAGKNIKRKGNRNVCDTCGKRYGRLIRKGLK